MIALLALLIASPVQAQAEKAPEAPETTCYVPGSIEWIQSEKSGLSVKASCLPGFGTTVVRFRVEFNGKSAQTAMAMCCPAAVAAPGKEAADEGKK